MTGRVAVIYTRPSYHISRPLSMVFDGLQQLDFAILAHISTECLHPLRSVTRHGSCDDSNRHVRCTNRAIDWFRKPRTTSFEGYRNGVVSSVASACFWCWPSCRWQWILQGCSGQSDSNARTVKKILNVSYDPTRELYEDFNQAFAKHWEKETGEKVDDRAVARRLGQAGAKRDRRHARPTWSRWPWPTTSTRSSSKADGLIAKDWQKRLPNNSAPYTSTIVFLVRKGNPKGIKDWDDLVKPGVEVVTPDPKTSGGARWNYLAAWGYALKRELGDLAKLNDPKQADAVAKAQEKAREFVEELYRHVKVLDTGARGATLTFVKNGAATCCWPGRTRRSCSINDMKKGEFEIVVPSVSILAEPSVAVVDKIVDKHGTRKVAEAYLKYLYSPEGQTIAAKHYYRPRDAKSVPAEYLKRFSKVELFTIDDVFGGWREGPAASISTTAASSTRKCRRRNRRRYREAATVVAVHGRSGTCNGVA